MNCTQFRKSNCLSTNTKSAFLLCSFTGYAPPQMADLNIVILSIQTDMPFLQDWLLATQNPTFLRISAPSFCTPSHLLLGLVCYIHTLLSKVNKSFQGSVFLHPPSLYNLLICPPFCIQSLAFSKQEKHKREITQIVFFQVPSFFVT